MYVGGLRSHGIVIAVEDRRYRLTGGEAGEVVMYDDLGQAVHLKRDRILISSPNRIQVEAPKVVILSDDISLGAEGGAKVARVGDTVEGGVITSGSDKVKAA
jgi:phage gp45-like